MLCVIVRNTYKDVEAFLQFSHKHGMEVTELTDYNSVPMEPNLCVQRHKNRYAKKKCKKTHS